VKLDVNLLIKDAVNARSHDLKNIEAIKGSLKRFGQQKPIVVTPENIVIAGNGTLEAARQLGWKEIWAHVTDLKGVDRTAFALADNRSAELATWDDEILGKTLQALREENFDLDSIGFDTSDLDKFLDDKSKDGLTDDDEIPEVEQNIHGVKSGDVWILGAHRLMCGDSTNVQHIEKLMNGEKAEMVFTDPPYGINLDTDFGKNRTDATIPDGRKVERRSYKKVQNDDQIFDPNFILAFFKEVKEIFLWGANYYIQGSPEHSYVCWDKKLSESGDKNVIGDFELCWSKHKHKNTMIRAVWHGPFGHNKKTDGAHRVHPTQKPVKICEEFLIRWSIESQLIVDLFLGSGSTLIACEKTNRKCYGMEIDPHYCSVIIERWQKFTGKKAVKEDAVL
jgi:DNA modification methylase